MKYKISLLVFIVSTIILNSCVSREKTIYLHSRGTSSETIEHQKNNIKHKITPGDILYIKILSINPDITELFNIESSNTQSTYSNGASLYIKGFFVNDSGYIKLPVIDTVQVAGLSLNDAELRIQTEVDKYFKNSTLIVKLLNFNISVLGEVNRPGTFEVFKQELTVFEAIARAGGVQDYANISEVLIIRSLKDKNETFRIDLTDASIMDSERLFLLPNDVIIVEPLKSKHFRVVSAPNISLILSAITTTILVLNFVLRSN